MTDYKKAKAALEEKFRSGQLSLRDLTDEFASLADATVRAIAKECRFEENRLCLVALGGYARRQLSPHSDLDLLIVHDGELSAKQDGSIAEFTTRLWDTGGKPGIQITDLTEIGTAVDTDDIIRTSYIDNFFIAGYEPHYHAFVETVNEHVIRKGRARFLSGKILNAQKRAEEYSDSIYRLEPNLKEGKGGIRDINTIWWISSVYYHITSFAELHKTPFFTEESYENFDRAAEFIFRIRAELHYETKRKFDILRREFQPVIAERLGFKSNGRYSAVENFMREYYISARIISNVAEKATFAVRTELIRPGEQLPVLRALPGGLISYDNMLSLNKNDVRNMEKIALLIRQSIVRSQPIHPSVADRLSSNAASITDEDRARWGHIIGDLLGDFPYSAHITGELHRMGLLEAYIPEFSDIVCRMQYNTYHHYTVDEHTLLALERLDAVATGRSPFYKQFYELLTNLPRKDLLGLAVLLHDIGKGGGARHNESGAEMVKQILPRLGYNENDTALVSGLVLNHLVMAHISQRRDLDSREEIANFARAVPSSLELDLLYLLTYADITALGGKQATNWELGLLEDLYLRTKDFFTWQGSPELFRESVLTKKKDLLKRLTHRPSWQKFADDIDDGTIYTFSTNTLLDYIGMIAELDESGEPAVEFREIPNYRCWQITVCAADEFGLMRKIVGVISSQGCNILKAQIYTPKRRPDSGGGQAVIDTIQFTTAPSDERTPEKWQDDMKAAVIKAVTTPGYEPEMRYTGTFADKNKIQRKRTQVLFDNSISSVYTVIDIFTPDRIGLLYDILGVFEQNGIDVRHAKISTDIDTVVDSFSVADREGRKITDEGILSGLKEAIYEISADSLHRR